jgi:regulator of replication initiation timing
MLLASCDAAPEGSTEPAADASGIVIENDAVEGGLSRAQQIARHEGEIKQQDAAFIELNAEFERRYGRRLDGVSLSDDQAGLLRTMLANEQDVTLKGLLQSLLDTEKNTRDLERQIAELKAQLPAPSVVSRGDSHLGLAADWLAKNHGLEKAEAEKLARRSLLTENLAPGMEVWHFYADGVYASSVTQGTAKVSPYLLNVRAMKKLQQERDDAMALAQSLEAELTVLEATRDQLQSSLASLETRHREVVAERDDLQVENTELIEDDESVWYYVDTKRRLRDKDILRPAGIRLKDWRKDLFTERIDLRRTDSLEIYAEDFGTAKIRGLSLLPDGMWTEGRDYTVELNETGTRATLHLDSVDKFKNEAFVLVLK